MLRKRGKNDIKNYEAGTEVRKQTMSLQMYLGRKTDVEL